MGLQLRRTPVLLTQLFLGLGVITLFAAPPLVGLLASRDAAASGTPDITKIHFLTTTRYVRENNTSDIAARLITYNATTNVNFYIDGNITPVAGIDAGASGKYNHQWRLFTPLAAGEHTVTATVEIDGTWYEVAGQATAYSLGMPDVSYVLPSAESSVFRPTDTPLRLKIDDTFNQFKNATFSIYTYDTVTKKFGQHVGSFTVQRAVCDLSKAGSYVLCDVTSASNWAPLSDGITYGVKLTTNTMASNGVRTNMSDYWTTFSVDGTAPVIDDFHIVGTTTAGSSISVAAKAADSNLESVDFYVTRSSGGSVCAAGSEKIAEKRVTASTPGNFSAILDVSDATLASGGYCVNAVARDKAGNDSLPSFLPFVIDHTAPVATLRITSSSSPSASTPVTVEGTVDDGASLELFKDGVKVDEFNLIMAAAGQWSYRFDGGFDKGAHSLRIVATDAYGNSSTQVTSPASFANVNVSAYIPPAAVRNLSSLLTPPRLVSTPVTHSLSSAQIVASQHVSSVPKTDTGAVLGTQTQSNQSPEVTASTPIAPSTSGWTLFGIAWYWWALFIALLVGGGSWFVSNIRRQRQFA
jgi:hypothetical protein